MGFFVDVAQALNAIVRIDLSSGKTCMSEQLFYRIQLSAVSSKVCGKTMAQNMWTFFLSCSDEGEVFLNDIVSLP